ncbi:MAG: 16S rRNA (cytosine(1402)-N(4))-methyltransferase RsmH [Actinobacteria bacterium]|nr:16S rRNA (cytosine(1402)-N(4))-methyltransferase RsmH [Actinomycetota bacterium]
MINVHLPVLREEVVSYLSLKKGDIVFDGTLGGAGHTVEIIKAIAPTGKLIGADLDSQAISTAARKIESEGLKKYVYLVKDNYANIKNIIGRFDIKSIDRFFLDLGLSSNQLERSGRGFSYIRKEKLDMRFDQDGDLSAYDVVNEYSEEELKDIFYRYGEEPWSASIAKAIASTRQSKAIEFTDELVEIIKQAVPAKFRYKGHPAKRVFQAIRIEVNGELSSLAKALTDAMDVLNPQGRIAVITFHSLEDRIVKNHFETFAGKCICPPDLPICVCGAKKRGFILTKKPVIASREETEQNPRSKSAKLRVFEKL